MKIVRPPVELEKRKKLSLKAKLQLMIDHPKCYLCGERLGKIEDTDFDHPIALGLTGSNEMLPVHRVPCHKDKTARDKKAIAKAKRIRRKESGDGPRKKRIQSRPWAKRSGRNKENDE